MDIPKIVITSADGTVLNFNNLPKAIQDSILEQTSKTIHAASKIPTVNIEEKIALSVEMAVYMKDAPEDPGDRGLSPIDSKVRDAMSAIMLVREFHRDILTASIGNDDLYNTDQKGSLCAWARDEAALTAALKCLEAVLCG